MLFSNVPRRGLRSVALFLTALILAAVAAPRPAAAQDVAQGVAVAEVRFEGVTALDPEDLLRRIESRPGTLYDLEKVRADLKRLARLASEAEVRREPGPEGLTLVFVLKENPALEAVRFVGATQIDEERLRKVVRVEAGEVLTRDVVRMARDRVAAEYRRQGFMRANVGADLIKGSGEGRILQVLVDEGERVKVEDVVVEGAEHFSTLRVKALLETKGSWAFFKSWFDEDAFRDDLRRIEELYQSAGFFDVRVERGAFDWDAAKRVVTPHVVIDEGPRYVLGDVDPRGNTFFTDEEIAPFFEPMLGEPFDAQAYALGVEKVRDLYGGAGFVTTEFGEDFSFDPDTGRATVDLLIDEKRRVRVGDVKVRRPERLDAGEPSWFGRIYENVAPPVENDVIRREVALTPGEVYDKRLEDRTIRNLRALNVFETVEVESRATGDPEVRDVVIQVEEGVTGRVLVGVGYAEAFGAYGFGRYVERNFLGEAGDLNFDLMVGTREINASISYLDRYLGDSRNSLFTEIHRINADRPGYDETNTGAKAELGTPINDRWKAWYSARLEYVQLDEAGYDPDADFNVDYPVAALGMRLTRDTRESERLIGRTPHTTKGSLAGFGLEAGVADGPLAKLTGNLETYRKLGERWVLATDWRAGLMPVDADEVGPTERFYMGGTEDLRGFRYRRAGPHDSGDDDVPLGGATKLLARNELRYPLLDNLTGLLFLDAGVLGHDVFEFDTPRASGGVGARLDVKGVQLGVDLAAPFLEEDDDAARYFHFRLSTMKRF